MSQRAFSHGTAAMAGEEPWRARKTLLFPRCMGFQKCLKTFVVRTIGVVVMLSFEPPHVQIFCLWGRRAKIILPPLQDLLGTETTVSLRQQLKAQNDRVLVLEKQCCGFVQLIGVPRAEFPAVLNRGALLISRPVGQRIDPEQAQSFRVFKCVVKRVQFTVRRAPPLTLLEIFWTLSPEEIGVTRRIEDILNPNLRPKLVQNGAVTLFLGLGCGRSILEVFVEVTVGLVAVEDVSNLELVIGLVAVLAAIVLIPLPGNFEVRGLQAPVGALSARQKRPIIIRAAALVSVDTIGRQFPHVRIAGFWDQGQLWLQDVDFRFDLRRFCLHVLYELYVRHSTFGGDFAHRARKLLA